MQRYGISQLPVVRNGECESLADVIGSLQDRALLERVFIESRRAARGRRDCDATTARRGRGIGEVDEVFATLTGGMNAVVVARDGKPVGVLTRSDLLEFLAHRR